MVSGTFQAVLRTPLVNSGFELQEQPLMVRAAADILYPKNRPIGKVQFQVIDIGVGIIVGMLNARRNLGKSWALVAEIAVLSG